MLAQTRADKEDTVRLLFVCTSNCLRSPTFEDWFRFNTPHQVLSAGTEDPQYNYRSVNAEMVGWADKIICMEKEHAQWVKHKFPESKDKIKVLHIPDQYERNDPDLIKLIKRYYETSFKDPKHAA